MSVVKGIKTFAFEVAMKTSPWISVHSSVTVLQNTEHSETKDIKVCDIVRHCGKCSLGGYRVTLSAIFRVLG